MIAPNYVYNAKLVRVKDGDTFVLMVDVGFESWRKIEVRLAEVDTPEVWGVKHSSEEYKMGKKASNYVKQWFEENSNIVIKSIIDRNNKNKRGSFKRYLVYVYSNGKCLNDELIDKGWGYIA